MANPKGNQFPLRIGSGQTWTESSSSSSSSKTTGVSDAGPALLSFLLKDDPYADGTKSSTVLPPTFIQATGDTVSGPMTAKQIVGGGSAAGPAKVDAAYAEKRQQIKDNLVRDAVWVYQRAYSVTTASSSRPFLCTGSISPCICVVVHRQNRCFFSRFFNDAVAAMAHFDKDQDHSSLKEILDLPEFSEGDVYVHFYGGCMTIKKDENPASNPSHQTLAGLLNALYQHNKSHGRFILSAFDVAKVCHNDSFVFDVRDGSKHTVVAPLMTQGFWLDSLFRMWPNGTYIPIDDSSNMAEKHANVVVKSIEEECKKSSPPVDPQTNDQYREYRKIRVQWNGASGAETFWLQSNELIARLIMEQVHQANPGVPAPTLETYKKLLIKTNSPMVLEQSLKQWFQWSVKGQPEDKAKAQQTIVGIISQMLSTSAAKPLLEKQIYSAINKYVAQWWVQFEEDLENKYPDKPHPNKRFP